MSSRIQHPSSPLRSTTASVARRVRAAEAPLPFVRVVFGVSRDVPLTYVSRARVDGRIAEGLSRDRHVFLHGGSRQGKTSAWRVALEGYDPLVVPCGGSTTRAQINAAILRRAGASVTLSDRPAPSGERGLIVEVPDAPVPVHRRDGTTPRPGVPGAATSRSVGRFEVDPLAPVEVAGILDLLSGPGSRHYVVIEDFHRLPADLRSEFGVDLKVFHDCSRLLFVLVMIPPKEGSVLEMLNPELRDRSVSVDAEGWSRQELLEVVERGEQLLNIEIPDPVKDSMLWNARGNVGRVQELCYGLCRLAGVQEPQSPRRKVGTLEEVRNIAFQHFAITTSPRLARPRSPEG